MALLWFDGFDHYGDDETKLTEGIYDQADSVFSISSENPRTGSKNIRRSSSSTSGLLTRKLSIPVDTFGLGFSFYIDQLPNSDDSYVIFYATDENDTQQISCILQSDGSIVYRLANESGGIIASSDASVVTAGEYVHFENAIVADSGNEVEILESSVYSEDFESGLGAYSFSGSGASSTYTIGSDDFGACLLADHETRSTNVTLTSPMVSQTDFAVKYRFKVTDVNAGDCPSFRLSFPAGGGFSVTPMRNSASDSQRRMWYGNAVAPTTAAFSSTQVITNRWYEVEIDLSGANISIIVTDLTDSSVFASVTTSVSALPTNRYSFNVASSQATVVKYDEIRFLSESGEVITTSDGIIETRINGVTEISKSNSKTTSTTDKNYQYIKLAFGSSMSHGVTTDIDDYFIWDDSGSWNNSFLGDRRCFLISPNQDTNIADFVPSSGTFGYKMIDDDSPDEGATFILAESALLTGSPPSGSSEFEIQNLPSGVSHIAGVSVFTRAAKTDSDDAEIFTSIISGVNSVSGSPHELTESYGYHVDLYEYDPATIANFTKDGFDLSLVSVNAEFAPGPGSPEGSPGEGSPSDGGIPTSGLITHYTMDNISGSTLVDETGNFDGTILGATDGGGHLDFDGVNDRVDNSRDTKVQTWAWFINITPDVIGSNDAIIDHVAGISATHLRFPNTSQLRFSVYNGAFVHLLASVTASANYRIVAQHDGTDTELWVNGTLADSVSGFGAITYGGTESGRRIGADATNTAGRFFDGKVFEYAEYNRMLTPTEIGEHFS